MVNSAAISSLFDRVAADKQTHYDNNSCIVHCQLPQFNYFIITSTRQFVSNSQGGRCVKPMALLHLTVGGFTSHVDYTVYTYSYNDRRLARAVPK